MLELAQPLQPQPHPPDFFVLCIRFSAKTTKATIIIVPIRVGVFIVEPPVIFPQQTLETLKKNYLL